MASGTVTQVEPRTIRLPVGESITISSADNGSYGSATALTLDASPQQLAQGSIASRGSLTLGPFPVAAQVQITPLTGSLCFLSKFEAAPTQVAVAVPAFVAGNVAGAGGTNATVALAATTTSKTSFLTIDNTGAVDAEVWFGAPPADANVNQSPKKGKLLPAGAGLFFDVRIPVGPIYVTAAAATGLSVVTG